MRESSCPSLIQGEERGFPEALGTWRVTCWAPVCVLISICDCTQIQGGRHSAVLKRPLVLADWGCFICWLAEIQHSLSPRPPCLSQVTLMVTVVPPCPAALQGGLGEGIICWWSHSKLSWTWATISWGSRLCMNLGRVPRAFEWVMLFNRRKCDVVSFCSFNTAPWEWWGLHYFPC